jgi:VanZ family protein
MSWIAPFAWAALIWFLSSIQIRVPGGGRASVDFLTNLAHAGVFGILALLAVPLAPRRDGWVDLDRGVLWMLAAPTLAYAVLDEVHQAFVAGRHATPFDVLTDATGIYCTLKVVLYLSERGATGRGLVLRLAGGLGLCALSAAFATLAAV